MKNTKTQVNLPLAKEKSKIEKNSFLTFMGFNKPYLQKIEASYQKATINKETKNVFIRDNSVHFDKNVIIKENSQFLPKIKNIVNEYQTEKNKYKFWLNNNNQPSCLPVTISKRQERAPSEPAINLASSEDILGTNNILELPAEWRAANEFSQHSSLRQLGAEPSFDSYFNNKNKNEGDSSNKSLILNKPNSKTKKKLNTLSSIKANQKKVEILKLNKIKKGNLLNKTLIEHLNSLASRLPMVRVNSPELTDYLNPSLPGGWDKNNPSPTWQSQVTGGWDKNSTPPLRGAGRDNNLKKVITLLRLGRLLFISI